MDFTVLKYDTYFSYNSCSFFTKSSPTTPVIEFLCAILSALITSDHEADVGSRPSSIHQNFPLVGIFESLLKTPTTSSAIFLSSSGFKESITSPRSTPSM